MGWNACKIGKVSQIFRQTGTCRGAAPPSCWRKTVLSLAHPTGVCIVELHSTNAKLSEWNSAISQTRTYHFPLAIRPPTKMTEKIAAKNRNVSQIGLSTHNHDHEIKPITFSTTKIKVKATTGSVPERLDFFSIHLSPRNPNYRARINPQQPNFSSSTNPSDW